jgi:hypothetical protein
MITKEQAMTAREFNFKISNRSNKHFGEERHCRRNGATKTWKTRPNEFKVPVKYGLYEYFYITHENADQFEVRS